jgi:carboxypeptidase D
MGGSRALAACGLLSLSVLIPAALAGKTAADYFVHSLPGAPDGPLLKMHAGYVFYRIRPRGLF